MQHFLIKDGQGTSKDFGNSAKAAKFAEKFLAAPAFAISFMTTRRPEGGHDVHWCLSDDVGYFTDLLAKEGLTVTFVGKANEVIANHEASRPGTYVPEGSARCRHPKFGEGSIIREDERAAEVLFDGQKKSVRMVPAAIERI